MAIILTVCYIGFQSCPCLQGFDRYIDFLDFTVDCLVLCIFCTYFKCAAFALYSFQLLIGMVRWWSCVNFQGNLLRMTHHFEYT